MTGILLTFALAVIFGALIFGLRVILIREPDQMRRFLDRRFDVISRKGFWGEERDYIDEKMVKRWGYNGWSLIPLPAFNLSLHYEVPWNIGNWSSIFLLIFAGIFLADSRVGIRFMKILGVDRYQKSVVSDACD